MHGQLICTELSLGCSREALQYDACLGPTQSLSSLTQENKLEPLRAWHSPRTRTPRVHPALGIESSSQKFPSLRYVQVSFNPFSERVSKGLEILPFSCTFPLLQCLETVIAHKSRRKIAIFTFMCSFCSRQLFSDVEDLISRYLMTQHNLQCCHVTMANQRPSKSIIPSIWTTDPYIAS